VSITRLMLVYQHNVAQSESFPIFPIQVSLKRWGMLTMDDQRAWNRKS
jgi:hypothetical protein